MEMYDHPAMRLRLKAPLLKADLIETLLHTVAWVEPEPA